MKAILMAAALLGGLATMPVAAQTANDSGETPAVATPDTRDTTVPVAGENSFTEAQAKQRIADAGYTDVSTLALDADGVWRGTAVKAGRAVKVGLDYQGNVVPN